MKEMSINILLYDLRDAIILTEPTFNTFSYGQNSFKYYGTHI